MSRFFSVDELADRLGIGRSTAYLLVKSTGFPFIKIGRIIRIPEDDFETWCKEELHIHEYR